MRILALDQASITSGFAVFEDGKLINSGVFSFNDSILGKRLVKIRNKVNNLIEQYKINFVAFEDIQEQNNNVRTYEALAEVRGVLEELLHELKIPYQIVSPGTWRHGLGIKGNVRKVQKKNAQDYVIKTYGLQVSEDESDAICIGTYIKNEKESAF